MTAPVRLSAPSGTSFLRVCVFVSVNVLPSGENTKWLSSPKFTLPVFTLPTMSNAESSIRLKERETGPIAVSVPSRFKLVSS
jgi:hypothetical protein